MSTLKNARKKAAAAAAEGFLFVRVNNYPGQTVRMCSKEQHSTRLPPYCAFEVPFSSIAPFPSWPLRVSRPKIEVWLYCNSDLKSTSPRHFHEARFWVPRLTAPCCRGFGPRRTRRGGRFRLIFQDFLPNRSLMRQAGLQLATRVRTSTYGAVRRTMVRTRVGESG